MGFFLVKFYKNNGLFAVGRIKAGSPKKQAWRFDTPSLSGECNQSI